MRWMEPLPHAPEEEEQAAQILYARSARLILSDTRRLVFKRVSFLPLKCQSSTSGSSPHSASNEHNDLGTPRASNLSYSSVCSYKEIELLHVGDYTRVSVSLQTQRWRRKHAFLSHRHVGHTSG